ncbi:MAG: CoA transferase [Magnetococcales bacterium]|nr:CoA transferase [Magnetococcales bacterium]
MEEILRSLLATVGQEQLTGRYACDVATSPAVVDTRFRADEAAVALSLAGGILTSHIWESQTGRAQSLQVDQRVAALTLLSFMLQTQNGYPICYPDTHRVWPAYPIMAPYETRDGRHIYIDGVYPHLRDGLLDLLDCPNNATALSAAIKKRDARELEAEINRREMCGTIVRTREEWLEHPQGRLLNAMPMVKITKVKEGLPTGFVKGAQPLSGIKVLDITHVLAGPMSTRALAGQGAQVLHLSGPNVFELFPFSIDTGHGKRNAFIDLKQEKDKLTLRQLIQKADIFVQGYAPGKFKRFGFAPEDLFAMKDGLIYLTVSCYGTEGPCGTWGGFEQLGQAASGLMAAHSSLTAPRLVPAAVCDYLTGYLGTLGMLAALIRRASEGGSYHVEVSLARTAMWLLSLGHRKDAEIPGQLPADIGQFLVDHETCFGNIRHLRPVVEYSETRPHFKYPVSALGSSSPVWVD